MAGLAKVNVGQLPNGRSLAKVNAGQSPNGWPLAKWMQDLRMVAGCRLN